MPREIVRRRAEAVPAVSVIAAAIGAAAFGAIAVGAVAIGALAIGRLAVGRITVKRARFQMLEVRWSRESPEHRNQYSFPNQVVRKPFPGGPSHSGRLTRRWA